MQGLLFGQSSLDLDRELARLQDRQDIVLIKFPNAANDVGIVLMDTFQKARFPTLCACLQKNVVYPSPYIFLESRPPHTTGTLSDQTGRYGALREDRVPQVGAEGVMPPRSPRLWCLQMLHKRVAEASAASSRTDTAAELPAALAALSRLLLVSSFRGEVPEAEFRHSIGQQSADAGGDAVAALLRAGFVVRMQRGRVELLLVTMPGAGSVVRHCARIFVGCCQNCRIERGLGPGSMGYVMFRPSV